MVEGGRGRWQTDDGWRCGKAADGAEGGGGEAAVCCHMKRTRVESPYSKLQKSNTPVW
jgi:hypothetical protein